jgi:flagellar biosynthesis/type III secretory pathway protein FliH
MRGPMSRKSKRKAPPSRIKYENSHPTVSCRVSKELYDRLSKSKEVDGKSFADILKIGLGIAEKDDKKLVEAKQESYDEGYNEGHKDALEEHGIHE